MEESKRSWSVGSLLRTYGLLLVIILMVVVMSVATPVFISSGNIINVIRQISINGVLAVGMTFVILTGGIELSVGAIMAASGVVAGNLMLNGANAFVAVIAALLVGMIFGAASGVSIAYFGLPPFIATLAIMAISRGFAMVYSDGKPFSISNKAFMNIGKGAFLGIPIPIIILVLVCAIAIIVLNLTVFGRNVYAFGGNRSAAKSSGVKIKLVEMSVYIISGLLAGLAAIILAARISSGQPTAGQGQELDAIAAVAIGGTSMIGGVGKMSGTIMGFVIIGIITNALTLLNVSSFWQSIVKGGIILIAVLLDIKTKGKETA